MSCSIAINRHGRRPPAELARAGLIAAAGLAVVAGLCGRARAARQVESPPSEQRSTEMVVGITAPHRKASLASVLPGRIARISVAEGALVRANESVFTLEDGVQRSRTQMAKAAAESTLDVDLGKARWERARKTLDRLTRLYGDASASSKEVDDAVAEAEIMRLEYERAKFVAEQLALAYERERRALEQFDMRAPFTGYVSKHLKHEGETVHENEPVVILVELHPLEVSVDCPLSLATSVHVGDRVWLRPVDAQWQPRLGLVSLTSRVADGASQTFKVKIVVDNEQGGWMSGVKVTAMLPGLAAKTVKPVSFVEDAKASPRKKTNERGFRSARKRRIP